MRYEVDTEVELEAKCELPESNPDALISMFDDIGLRLRPQRRRVQVRDYLDTEDFRLARAGISLAYEARDDQMLLWFKQIEEHFGHWAMYREYTVSGPVAPPVFSTPAFWWSPVLRPIFDVCNRGDVQGAMGLLPRVRVVTTRVYFYTLPNVDRFRNPGLVFLAVDEVSAWLADRKIADFHELEIEAVEPNMLCHQQLDRVVGALVDRGVGFYKDSKYSRALQVAGMIGTPSAVRGETC